MFNPLRDPNSLPSTAQEAQGGWKSLVHEFYQPERALRAIVEIPSSTISLKGALKVRLSLHARLAGEQERSYANSLYQSIFTENPIRGGIAKDCLLYEIEHRDELKNHPRNNFKDVVTKAILEAGYLDPYEHPGRKAEEPTLCRNSLPKLVRARISELTLPEIKHWLMDGRSESVTNYFYRVLVHMAHERAPIELGTSEEILGSAVSKIFFPEKLEPAPHRIKGLVLLNPAFLNTAIEKLSSGGEPSNSCLGSDVAAIRKKLSNCGNTERGQMESWLKSVPALEALVAAG